MSRSIQGGLSYPPCIMILAYYLDYLRIPKRMQEYYLQVAHAVLLPSRRDVPEIAPLCATAALQL